MFANVVGEHPTRPASRARVNPACSRRVRSSDAVRPVVVVELVVVMPTQDEHRNTSGETDGEKHRDWPSLTLKGPSGFDPTYASIEDGHDLYPLAAWARHHADELSPAARRGLFAALARAWPVTGRRKRRYKRGVVFSLLLKHGVSSSQIAEKWHVSRGDVTDAARDAEAQAGLVSQARIVVANYDSFDDYCNVEARAERLEENPQAHLPYDPATSEGAVLSRPPDEGNDDENWRLATELANDLGYKDLAHLLGVPSDAQRRREAPMTDAEQDQLIQADIERYRERHTQQRHSNTPRRKP